MKITNKQRVLDYIKQFGSITTLEAFRDLGNTRLSASIYCLKKDGYKIKSELIPVTTRFGNKVYVSKYSLIENELSRDEIISEYRNNAQYYDDMTYIL